MLSNDTKHYLVYDGHRYEKGIWISPTPNFSWKKHWEETSQIWDFLYLAGIVDLHTRSQNDQEGPLYQLKVPNLFHLGGEANSKNRALLRFGSRTIKHLLVYSC